MFSRARSKVANSDRIITFGGVGGEIGAGGVGGSGVIKFNPAQRGRCQRYPQEEANHSQNVFQLQKEY